ncbi:helicase [Gryganskiella cystojenkinii]|nr:helicase [Gryganskiella cystojenkinii]
MIISYEKLRLVQEDLKTAGIDIIIADEGHRLKSANIKTAQAIRSMPTKRRIILSGTPIQNDLGEFFAMIDFVNPGLFENYGSFKKVFEEPILRSRQPDCSRFDASLGTERIQEDAVSNTETGDLYSCFQDLVPTSDVSGSSLVSVVGGKLRFVEMFLRSLKRNTSERVVLVSNFTQTLDLFEGICQRENYGYFRLDGSTPTQKRQEYVDKFNTPTCTKFVFLLSAKSGGMGLNLVGASRLIMFDIDWNPSVDTQAMARIHRDGQMKPVFIYRLLLSGTIEEKIYQRQLAKIGLSDALMNGNSSEKANKFSAAQLRDLFSLEEDESCMTHSLLGCECSAGDKMLKSGKTMPQLGERRGGDLDRTKIAVAKKELDEWQHINPRSQDESSLILQQTDKILWEVVCDDTMASDRPEEFREESDERARSRATVGFVLARHKSRASS